MIILILTGCGRTPDKSPKDPSTAKEVFSSTPPFKTLEPSRYQAIRVVSVTSVAGTSELSRTQITKDGASRREENIGPHSTVYLYLSQGNFVLLPDQRIYSEATPIADPMPETPATGESPNQFLHEGASETLYRQLGQEEISGRRLQKYQVVVNTSPAPNVSNTESLVWFDEELGMPVRTEIKSGNGNRTLIELVQIKREVDTKLFQIPADYRKVTHEEMRHALRK